MTNKRPPLDFDAIKIAANGKWIDTIFRAVGIQFDKAPKQHQPCPVCGGTDRFRCDNKKGDGTWICSNCGAGDGFKLVANYTNTHDGYDLMAMIGGILGVGATSTITPEQREQWKAEQVAKEQARIQSEQDGYNKAQAEAQHRWDTSQAVGNVNYANRKQIIPLYARFDDECMLIPMVKWDNQNKIQILRNLQRIYPNGDKKMLFGGEVSHCYCPLGNDELFDNPSVVLIGEGYATTVTVAMAIQQSLPVVVAFTANNVLKVAQVMRERYPNARLIICADDDIETAKQMRQADIDKGNQPKPLDEYNAGVKFAKKAVEQYGAEYLIPNFDKVQAVT